MTANPENTGEKAKKKRQKTGGRKAGTPNKLTAPLKEAILLAAERAHPEGLVGYLTHQAVTNSASFNVLLGKVLPTTLASDPTNPMPAPQFIVQPVQPKPE